MEEGAGAARRLPGRMLFGASPRHCRLSVSQNHRLGKISKIIKSNHLPNNTVPTKAWRSQAVGWVGEPCLLCPSILSRVAPACVTLWGTSMVTSSAGELGPSGAGPAKPGRLVLGGVKGDAGTFGVCSEFPQPVGNGLGQDAPAWLLLWSAFTTGTRWL